MRMTELRLENFRVFEQLQLSFDPGPVVFAGDNAAGKTSLLEAIYVLGRGKSFRAPGLGELAGRAGRLWNVFARLRNDADLELSLGAGWSESGLLQRIDGRDATTLEALRCLPVQILEPGQHKLVEDGPSYRRSFIDWGVFHVEHSFLPTWRRYRRALRQRNELLKKGGSDAELAVWEPELAETGERLQAHRATHLQALMPAFEAMVAEWLPGQSVSADWYAGWPPADGLAGHLAATRTRDRRLGTTASGPHRAELRFKVDAHGAKTRISRGQQKLLLASLLFAQSLEIERSTGRMPMLLIDDFEAELAAGFQAWLLERVQAYRGPCFVTSFDARPFGSGRGWQMFHVEHGQVRRESGRLRC